MWQIISDNSPVTISIMSGASNCIVEQALQLMKLTILVL